MYCPNCGQQQISEEMRFCSRCGLALSGLGDWLASGGVPAKPGLPTKRSNEDELDELSPRRKGMRRAGKVMFFSGVLGVVFLAISLIVDEGALMFVPMTVLFVGIVMMLYSVLFSPKTAPISNKAAPAFTLDASSARGSLPPAATTAGPGINRPQVRTNELAQPPSVTEHTTRLLDNE
jgi:hypothetical protein